MAVWCGARKGGYFRGESLLPAADHTWATSTAASGESIGTRPGRHRAKSVFPEPGGPHIRR